MDLKEITRKDVKDTVFSIIESNIDGNCRIAIANNIISRRTFENEEKARNYINNKPWELIENMIALYVDYAIAMKVTQKQLKNVEKEHKN